MTERSTRLAASPDVLAARVGEELVLLDVVNGRYYSLDEIGGRFWEVSLEQGDVEGAVRVLHGEYDVDESVLRADLERLCDDLVDKGLLLRGQ